MGWCYRPVGGCKIVVNRFGWNIGQTKERPSLLFPFVGHWPGNRLVEG